MPSVDEHPGRPTAGIARVKNVVCFSCFHSCPFLWLWYWGTERERDVSLHNCQASGPSVILWATNWCNLWLCQQVDLLSHNWERLRTSGQFTAIQGSGALLSYCGVWACPNSNSSFCVVGALWCGIFFLFCWGFCLLEYIIFFHSTFFLFNFLLCFQCYVWQLGKMWHNYNKNIYPCQPFPIHTVHEWGMFSLSSCVLEVIQICCYF